MEKNGTMSLEIIIWAWIKGKENESKWEYKYTTPIKEFN